MATHDYDKIFAVKQNAHGRLLAIPGVHTIAFGAKYVGGVRTQEPAIMVYVEKKRPTSEIAAHEVIPPEIDGVKTDIIESPRPRLMAEDTKKHRPLDGGVQIRCGGSVGIGGTLGCIASIPGPVPKIVGITNQHCVGEPLRAHVATLDVVIDPRPALNAMTITGANLEGTLFVIDLVPNHEPSDRAYYQTTQKDTLPTIAQGIAKTITSIGGYSASAAGAQVTITRNNGVQFGHGAKASEIRLQRARMVGGEPPRGVILREPRSPYFVEEEEVPRAGVYVERSWQRARWLGGRTFIWIGRRKTAGKGEGWSQLAFDRIADIDKK